MLSILTFFGLLYTVFQTPANEVKQLRQLFFEARDSEAKADEFYEKIGKYAGNEGLLIAYKGGAYALKAKYSFNPISKLKSIKKSQEYFNEAVQKDPQNLEIRFMRYAVESQTPGALDLSDHVNEDKELLINGLKLYPKGGFTLETARIARDFLKQHCVCSDPEKQYVNQLKL